MGVKEPKKDPMFDVTGGACTKTEHPEIFFPEGHPHKIRELTIAAKNFCSSCPISEACLIYAMRNDEWGIWGGSTREERKELRRSKKNVAIHLRKLRAGEFRVTDKDENTIL